MDVTEYRFEMHDGTPPDGERRDFFGFNDDGAAFILRWNDRNSCWAAIGFDDRGEPIVHLLVDGNEGMIKRWADAPLRWSALGISPPEIDGEKA